jgi:hypothetical protein
MPKSHYFNGGGAASGRRLYRGGMDVNPANRKAILPAMRMTRNPPIGSRRMPADQDRAPGRHSLSRSQPPGFCPFLLSRQQLIYRYTFSILCSGGSWGDAFSAGGLNQRV